MLGLPFAHWLAENLHASEHLPDLILEATSERRNFVPSGMGLIGMGAKRRLAFFFVVLHK